MFMPVDQLTKVDQTVYGGWVCRPGSLQSIQMLVDWLVGWSSVGRSVSQSVSPSARQPASHQSVHNNSPQTLTCLVLDT